MNSKSRVLTAFDHRIPDRVPLDYSSNPGIDLRLKQHFGLAPDDHNGLLQALGVDFRYVWAPYTGPELHEQLPDRTVDLWGIHRRWIEHEAGGYWDYTDFPLREATLELVESWPMPNPDHFDYEYIARQARIWQDYCVVAGSAGVADIINSST
jgi:uroporphyrinogen decarboxylase